MLLFALCWISGNVKLDMCTGPDLFVILHDSEDGVYGAEDAQCHHGLIFALLVLLTLQNLTENLRLHRGEPALILLIYSFSSVNSV